MSDELETMLMSNNIGSCGDTSPHATHTHLAFVENNPQRIRITCPGIIATQVKDYGVEKTTFDTGGQREIPIGKGRFDLLAPEGITELAQHFEAGARKYADRNWEKGLPLRTFFNSGIDHQRDSYFYGKTDENHEAAWAWNAYCYLVTLRRIQNGQLPCELDDRPLPHEAKGHKHCMLSKMENSNGLNTGLAETSI